MTKASAIDINFLNLPEFFFVSICVFSFQLSDHHKCQDDHRQTEQHKESCQDSCQSVGSLLAEKELHYGIIGADDHFIGLFRCICLFHRVLPSGKNE